VTVKSLTATSTDADVEQPFPSVTSTVYVPLKSVVIVCAVP